MAIYRNEQDIAEALRRLRTTPVPPSRAQAQRIARLVAAQRAEALPRPAAPFPLPRPAWRVALAGALALAAVALIAGLLVALAGGNRPPIVARLITPATAGLPARLGERRIALLDALSWRVTRDIGPQASIPLAGGDMILAYQPVTITFADGSAAALAANTSAVVLETQRGIRLELGAATSRVARVAGAPPYLVRSPVAEYVVKGTVFHVRTDGVSDFIETDEGMVGVARAGQPSAQADVRAGEQLSVTPGAQPLIVEVRPPVLTLQTPEGAPAPPDMPVRRALVAVRGYPGSRLSLIDAANGASLADILLDSAGRALVALPLTGDGPRTVTGRLRAPDGRLSGPATLSFALDTQPPDIEISRWDNQAGQLRIGGVTEPGAGVTINGAPVAVDTAGRFAAEVAVAPEQVIQIVATDAAGNTRIVERRP